jgi:sugar lactone lactonase YvrE
MRRLLKEFNSMSEHSSRASTSRRDLLRKGLGGALLLTFGSLLSGCGGTNEGTPVRLEDYDLLVSTFFAGTVERFNPAAGAHLGSVASGIDRSNGLAFGPGGDLFVAASQSGEIDRFAYPSGAKKDALKGLSTPQGMRIGPDGALYVTNAPSYQTSTAVGGASHDTIERFDPQSGRSLGTFAHAPTPFGLAFGPDGDLYVTSVIELSNTIPASDSALRFDGRTGAPLGRIVTGLKHAYDIAFDPDGNLLIPEYFLGRIRRYDRQTGRLIGDFAPVAFPIGLERGPDGALYVASFSDAAGSPNSGIVRRFDIRTGEMLGIAASGLPFASYLAFRRSSAATA